ncbi:metallophosphoesterase [Alteromonas gilva]|uniref:Metallophosphoesterase n=1 Tax=Alteromonas gilva TaxID=2987522 RepID=A0ABT5L3F6_9ALTE|nr:metallophosphoesterase [Alteromonas gilva]MDC8830392.1 metallophosphoesterase [Alteromonas gilva]
MKIKANALNKAPVCKEITIDDATRVFIVGDLDAHFDRLQAELNKVNFNPEQDVLFSLGDVIDRGPDSIKLLTYLQQIGAHMVLGNHEHMMLEALLGRDIMAMRLWIQNGGSWHQSESLPDLLKMCKWLVQQPLSFKLHYQGLTIGISHTLPEEWDWNQFPHRQSDVVWNLLWERERFVRNSHVSNHGVDFSVHGHNSTQQIRWISNSLHIDTSFYGRPTVIDLTTIIAQFRANIAQ